MKNKKKIDFPKVGDFERSYGTVVSIETINPPTPQPYDIWILEQYSARQELRWKDGSLFKELETLNDFHGLGTGEKSAITELKELCKKKGITQYSDMEAFVVRERVISRGIPKPYNPLCVVEFDYEHYPQTEEIDVWSSKKGYFGDETPFLKRGSKEKK